MDFERKVPRLRASLSFLLPDGWKGEVVDLSATGIRMRSLAVLERETEVAGTLVLPDGRKIALTGMVVWTSPPNYAAYMPAEIGLQLTNVPADYLEAVADLFAAQ
jgi:hypothetical protein